MTPKDRTPNDEQLRDVTPQRILDFYLDERSADPDTSPMTVTTHRHRLTHLVTWFNEETDYEFTRELDGFDLKQYKLWRFGSPENNYSEYSVHTVKGQMDTLRKFIRFCETVEAVKPGLAQKVKSPGTGDDGQRDSEIEGSRATKILAYLDRYHYASITHTLFHLLWYGLLRVGAARSIDLDDVDLADGYIKLRHRPPETTLKNGHDSERTITISETTASLLADYIAETRHDVTDDAGRRPLFTSQHGRPALGTLRNYIYEVTSPCFVTGECPHDREIDTCEATQNRNAAHRCPSSESTHAIRRGSISWHLEEKTPKQIVSERADVSVGVLDDHYNTLTEREQADVREDHLPDDLGD